MTCLFETVTIFDNLYDIYTGTYSGYGNIDQISVTTPDLVGILPVTADADSSYLIDFDPTGNSVWPLLTCLAISLCTLTCIGLPEQIRVMKLWLIVATGLLRHYARL